MQVRNLNFLNRDLSKCLLVTANTDAYHLQPDNAIKARSYILRPLVLLQTPLRRCVTCLDDSSRTAAHACPSAVSWPPLTHGC